MNLETVRELWPDAAAISDDALTVYVGAAVDACKAYLPTLDDNHLTASQTLAIVYQARAVYRQVLAGNSDQIGMDGMTVSVFPLDRAVRQLLRPRVVSMPC